GGRPGRGGAGCTAGACSVQRKGGGHKGGSFWSPREEGGAELTPVWKRGVVTRWYLTTWCPLDLDDGRTVNAIVFIMDPRHPEYESDTRAQVIAPLIAAASGPLGTNAQYLFSLEQELIKLGMQDDGLNDLLVSVKKLLAENFPDGVLRPGFA
ncbi:gamma-glutamylcyclotransferase, partial [Escherichia coli]